MLSDAWRLSSCAACHGDLSVSLLLPLPWHTPDSRRTWTTTDPLSIFNMCTLLTSPPMARATSAATRRLNSSSAPSTSLISMSSTSSSTASPSSPRSCVTIFVCLTKASATLERFVDKFVAKFVERFVPRLSTGRGVDWVSFVTVRPFFLPAVGCVTLAVDCSALAVDCGALAVGCSVLAVGCGALAVDCGALAVGCGVLAVGCRTLAVDCSALVVGCGRWAVGCGALAGVD